MTSNAAPHASGQGPGAPIPFTALLGSALTRLVVPLWLAVGAGLKLAERDPRLLPAPVRAVLERIATAMGRGSEADLLPFLDQSLRVIVGVEFALAAAMLFLPRLARPVAAGVLSLFVIILTVVIASGQASCGCFGKSGPPPWAVLIVDGLFLLGVITLRPAKVRGSAPAWVVAAAIGAIAAYAVPAKAGIDHPDGAPQTPSASGTQGAPAAAPAQTAPGAGAAQGGSAAQQQGSNATGGAPTAPPDKPAPPPAGVTPPGGTAPPPGPTPPAPPPAPAANAPPEWAAAPARMKPYYLPKYPEWVGKRLGDQEMMRLLKRPLPAGLDSGRWHVVFFRVDCDHCHELLEKHFKGKLPTRTLLVQVPDADPGPALANPCTECVKVILPRAANGPEYMIQTPVVLTVMDGVVKSVCEDVDNATALKATLEAK